MLYSFSIRCMYLLFWVAQFFNPKAKKWIEGRKNWRNKLPKLTEKQHVIWFHCASLGEFDQGLPLMNLLKLENPSSFLLVTFFSPSGFENYSKRKNPVDFACYLPLDTPNNARDFISHFNIKQFFIVKYEFWCNFIFEAKKQGLKIYSICAIFRPNQRFFNWYGAIFRKAIYSIDFIFTQTELSITLLKSINYTKCTVVGDMRFDKVVENKDLVQKDSKLEKFLGNEKAFILGSSWSIDEVFLQDVLLKIAKTSKIIIAPHDINEKHISEIKFRFKDLCIRYTEFETAYHEQQILILDCIGKLSNAYSYGKIAYVGGGFTGKLHNILEPAVFGLPILIGPKHSRFPEAELFINEGIAFSVKTELELNDSIQFILNNYSFIQEKAKNLVQNNKGVVNKIMLKIS